MNLTFIHKSASVLAMVALVATTFGAPFSAGATSTPEPDSCNEEYTYTFSSKDWGDYGDDFSKPGNIDYINTGEEGEPNNLTVSADAGFVITKVEVSVDDDGVPGFVTLANGPVTNSNPNGTELNVTKVTVKKVCASVTINQAIPPQTDPTLVSPINFTVVFSESVTGFATGDVTLSGTAGATTGTVTGSGTTYNVAVTGMTGPGTVIATVGANKATGAGGHGNLPSTSTDNQVTYQVEYTLSVTKVGTGTGTVVSDLPADINCGVDCSDPFPNGSVVELFQTASPGSVFAGWTGACTGNTTCFVTMNEAKSVTATFNLIPEYTLTVTKTGTGTGYVRSDLLSDIDCGPDCSDPFTSGALVELFATSSPGSVFAGWSGACGGTGSCFVTMDEAKSVTATFNDLPACSDGSDNDKDDATDYPADKGCDSAQDDDETNTIVPVSCEEDVELLTNGGFELPLVTSGSLWDIFPSGTANLGWLVAWTNPIGAPEIANIELQKDGLNGWTTPFGNQWTELDSDWNGHAPGPNNEAGGVIITQDIPTEVGATYTFSFDFAARPSASSAAQNSVEVLADGVVIGSVATSSTVWAPYTFDFVAADSVATLAIRYAGTPNDSLGAFVDNASAKCTEDVCVGEEETLTLVSDASTKVGENASVVLTPQPGGTIHPNWTASIPGASWIWSSEPLPNASSEVTETFTKTFTIPGTPDGATLWIAADNSYEVFVNGSTTPSCADATEFNYTGAGQDTCGIPSSALQTGSNTFVFKVKNHAQPNGTPSSNPAGLLYKLSLDYTTSCDEEEPEEDTGTLIINKVTEGGDGTFWFDIEEEYDSKVLYEILLDESDGASVTTEQGVGSTTKYLEEGWYIVSEIVPEGWNLEDITCTYEGEESEGVIIEDGYGYQVYIEEGETVTCTFYNEKERVSEDTPKDMCSNIEGDQTEVPEGTEQDDQGNCVTLSRSGNHRGGGGGGNGDGEVLGATSCGPLLTTYLHIGWPNDTSEVTKLQEFLNSHISAGLSVDGFFGEGTFDAVKAFQVQHGEDVLSPWVGLPGSGIDGEGDPTGYVYQTTRWQINNIWCPGSEAFPETLI